MKTEKKIDTIRAHNMVYNHEIRNYIFPTLFFMIAFWSFVIVKYIVRNDAALSETVFFRGWTNKINIERKKNKNNKICTV